MISEDVGEARAVTPQKVVDSYSDIEVIDDEETEENHSPVRSTPTLASNRESVSSLDLFFRQNVFSSMQSTLAKTISGINSKEAKDGNDEDGSNDSVETIDLSPGPKAYFHVPNETVNVFLNVCVLVTCAAVAGLGIGNYVSSFRSHDTLKRVEQQLIDCLQNQQILLENLSIKSEDVVDYGFNVDDYDLNFTTSRTHDIVITRPGMIENEAHLSVYLPETQTSLTRAPPSSLSLVSDIESPEAFSSSVKSGEDESSEELFAESSSESYEESTVGENIGHYSYSMKKDTVPSKEDHIGKYAFTRSKDKKLKSSDHLQESTETSTKKSSTYSYSRKDIPKQEKTVKEEKKSGTGKSHIKDDKNSKGNIPETQIVIETSALFEIPSEGTTGRNSRKRKRSQDKRKSVIVSLLLTEDGTSRPSFMTEEYTDSEVSRAVSTNFAPFLREEATSPFVVWLDKYWSASSIRKNWKGITSLQYEMNPWSKYQDKLTRHFWSNLKKQVYKSLRSRDPSANLEQQLKNEVIDSLLSLPSSSMQSAFSRIKSKVRKTLDRDT